MPFLNGLLLDAARLAAWALLVCAVFVPLERLAGIGKQAVLRRQFVVDFGYFVLNAIIAGVVFGTPLIVIAAAVHQVIPNVVLDTIAGWPAGVRLALGLVVGELGFYWGHRLSHEIPLLWRFHAIHHSSAEVDFLSNVRLHPVDMVFTRLCGFIPVLALGLTGGDASVAALLLVVGTLWGFFIHANLRWRFGPLEHIVTTPFFHRWHHTRDGLRDRNYAAMFSLVDHVFGTYHAPDHWPDGYGIDGYMPASWTGQLLAPFRSARAPQTAAGGRRLRGD